MPESASASACRPHSVRNLRIKAKDTVFDEKERKTGYFLLCPMKFVENEGYGGTEIGKCAHSHGAQSCRCVYFRGFSSETVAAGKIDGTEIESRDIFPVVECAFWRFKDADQLARYLKKAENVPQPDYTVEG